MDYYIINGKVYHDHAFQEIPLRVVDGKLSLCGGVPAGAETVDASGMKIVPGFIDIHTHGAVGVDVNGANVADLQKIGRFFASNGTTAWLGSVLTDTVEQTSWCIGQFNAYADSSAPDAAELLGVHLEGPFLASEYKGAMPEHLLRQGDAELLRHYQALAQGKIRYITVSPEVPGVADMIPEAKKLGILVGIGHSGATYAQAMEAIAKGAELCTHTFNAMRLFHQHEPAIFGAILESDVYCETICDGRHLAPGSVRMYCKCKGLDRIVAITDSIMAAGLPDGDYHLGVNEVVVEHGDAKLKSNGTRAGSTLTQDVALKNMLKWLPYTLEEILPTLSENPAKEMGLWDRKGSLETGKDADVVLLDEDANVVHVFARGNRVK